MPNTWDCSINEGIGVVRRWTIYINIAVGAFKEASPMKNNNDSRIIRAENKFDETNLNWMMNWPFMLTEHEPSYGAKDVINIWINTKYHIAILMNIYIYIYEMRGRAICVKHIVLHALT